MKPDLFSRWYNEGYGSFSLKGEHLKADSSELREAFEAGIDSVYPVFDTLNDLIKKGYSIGRGQNGIHLFRPNGPTMLSGKDFRMMCLNLIFWNEEDDDRRM